MDNSTDSFGNELDIQKNVEEYSDRVKEYNDKKVILAIKPSVSQLDDDEVERLYGNKMPFDLFRQNGKRVKLSTLAFEMGNPTLGKKLVLGENYNVFVVSFVASVIIASSFQITGVIAIFSGLNIYEDDNGVTQATPNDIGKYLVPMGGTLLGLSSGAFVGIFLFSLLMYVANPYNFNPTQGRSFINQYNNFLKKKLGIPADINLSYDFYKSNINLSMSIKL